MINNGQHVGFTHVYILVRMLSALLASSSLARVPLRIPGTSSKHVATNQKAKVGCGRVAGQVNPEHLDARGNRALQRLEAFNGPDRKYNPILLQMHAQSSKRCVQLITTLFLILFHETGPSSHGGTTRRLPKCHSQAFACVRFKASRARVIVCNRTFLELTLPEYRAPEPRPFHALKT